MSETAPDGVRRTLDAAITARVTPGGVVSVGTAAGPAYTVALGRHTYAADAAAVDRATVYDLASLTKVIATTTLTLRAHAAGTLPLDTPLALWPPGPAGADAVTVQDLLEHAAGFPAHRAYYREVAGRAGYLARITAEPAVYPLRAAHRYTDIGFMLLAAVLEDAVGLPLATMFDAFVDDVLPGSEIAFGVRSTWRRRVAPTGVDPWRGRVIAGHVHDSNAAALGGTAGHAGLFGTADAVGEFARWWLALVHGAVPASHGIPAALARRAVERSDVPGSSRALGWDTMLPTSSCGTKMSAQAFGHTGFTGTSLWIDPVRDLYVVCLTNRVHAADDGEGIRRLRIAVHEAVVDAWDAERG